MNEIIENAPCILPYMNLNMSVFYVRFLTARNSLNPEELFVD